MIKFLSYFCILVGTIHGYGCKCSSSPANKSRSIVLEDLVVKKVIKSPSPKDPEVTTQSNEDSKQLDEPKQTREEIEEIYEVEEAEYEIADEGISNDQDPDQDTNHSTTEDPKKEDLDPKESIKTESITYEQTTEIVKVHKLTKSRVLTQNGEPFTINKDKNFLIAADSFGLGTYFDKILNSQNFETSITAILESFLGTRKPFRCKVNYTWMKEKDCGAITIHIPFNELKSESESLKKFFKQNVFDDETKKHQGYFGQKFTTDDPETFLYKYQDHIPPYFLDPEKIPPANKNKEHLKWYLVILITKIKNTTTEIIATYSPLGYISDQKDLLTSIKLIKKTGVSLHFH